MCEKRVSERLPKLPMCRRIDMARMCRERERLQKKMMDQKKAAFTHFLFVYLLGGTHPHETKCHVTIASGTTKKEK